MVWQHLQEGGGGEVGHAGSSHAKGLQHLMSLAAHVMVAEGCGSTCRRGRMRWYSQAAARPKGCSVLCARLPTARPAVATSAHAVLAADAMSTPAAVPHMHTARLPASNAPCKSSPAQPFSCTYSCACQGECACEHVCKRYVRFSVVW